MPAYIPNPVEYGAFGETPCGVFSQSPLWARGPNPLISDSFSLIGVATSYNYLAAQQASQFLPVELGQIIFCKLAIPPYPPVGAPIQQPIIPLSSMVSSDRSSWLSLVLNPLGDCDLWNAMIAAHPVSTVYPYTGGPWFRIQSSKVTVKDPYNLVASPSGKLIPKITYAKFKYQPGKYYTAVASVYGWKAKGLAAPPLGGSGIQQNPPDCEVGLTDYQTGQRYPIYSYITGAFPGVSVDVGLASSGASPGDFSVSFDSRIIMGGKRYWFPYMIHPFTLSAPMASTGGATIPICSWIGST